MEISRRQLLAVLSVGVIDLMLKMSLFPQAKVKQNSIVTSGEKPCDETSIVANTKPKFKIGQTLKYRATTTKGGVSKGRDAKKMSSGEIVVEGEPLPVEQTISIADRREYKGNACFVVKRKAIVENPMYYINPAMAEKNSEESSTSYISESGKVLFSESTLVIRSGGSTSQSTSTNSDLPVTYSLHYFFGCWMLALSKDFSWECQRETPDGEKSFRGIRVKGMERVNDRDCYIVEYVNRSESKGTIITTYWIDAKERVAIQVERGNVLLTRIS